MSTGINVTNSSNITISWGLIVGMDTGISLEDTTNSILEGNIIITNEALNLFGSDFADVARAVQQSHDIEALAALANVIENPQTAVTGWSILVQKFGVSIGYFSISMLNGILSAAAWEALKMVLKSHGINI